MKDPGGDDERPRSGVLERSFAVLRAFDDRHLALSLTSIARRSGLPLNTALRLARSLVDVGALERRDDGLYVVGLGLFEIATLGPRSQGLRRVAMPFLEDLHSVTNEHVLLTVREEDEAVLVERLSSRDAGRVSYRVGGRLPLDNTGGGLVLLAHAPIALQEELILRADSTPPGGGLNGTTDGAALRRRLSAIRREGIAVAVEPGADGRGTVAAPIVGASGDVVAAVSVVAAADPQALAGLGPAVRLTARALSSAVAGKAR